MQEVEEVPEQKDKGHSEEKKARASQGPGTYLDTEWHGLHSLSLSMLELGLPGIVEMCSMCSGSVAEVDEPPVVADSDGGSPQKNNAVIYTHTHTIHRFINHH